MAAVTPVAAPDQPAFRTRSMHAALRDSELVVLDGAGHATPTERRRELAAVLAPAAGSSTATRARRKALAQGGQKVQDRPVDGDDARDELQAFLQHHFPQALPLSRYSPFDMPAIVSFEPDADLGATPEETLGIVAERVAHVYELVFAPDDRGWVCAVLRGAVQAALPERLTIDDVTRDGRVDLDAFVPQPVRPPQVDGLDVLIDTLPAEARDGVTITHGSDPFDDPNFPDAFEDGVPYVEVVARVRPRDVDHRSLIAAVVNQDFPREGRPRLVATLFVVDQDRPAILDLPDDRWFGVAMTDAEALRPVYESGLAPLNDYRRAEMEGIFGGWPEPARPDATSPPPLRRPAALLRRLLRRR